MSSEFLWQLLGNRSIIVSTSINTLIKLANAIILKLIHSGERVCVVTETTQLARYLTIEVLNKVEFTDPETACKECTYTIFLEIIQPRLLRTCKSENTYVFTTKLKTPRTPGYTRIYVKNITNGEYSLIEPKTGIYVRFTFKEGNIVFQEQLSGFYKKALDVLMNSMSTYGEISVKDAIRIIVHELGVERGYARRILEWLARHRYIRVIKGKITIASI
jgi:hypothetical protein